MKTNIILFASMLGVAISFSSTVSAEKAESRALNKHTTALLITDPQNDFLAEEGVAYGLVKENLKSVGTIGHIESLFRAAKQAELPVFVSPHQYYPHDARWEKRGNLVNTMHDIKMFHTSHPITPSQFKGSGADFLPRYHKYIYDGKTTITSPHKVFGPESNDLVLQLRKQGVQTVIVGGMAANLCTDSHMRELMEQGFEVVMVKDAVGAPGEAAYQAAMTNYEMIANAVVFTDEAIALML